MNLYLSHYYSALVQKTAISRMLKPTL